MSASLFLPNGVQTVNNQPEISRYYNLSGQPYLDTAEVVTEVTGRYVGQTFNVGGVEYWFKDGISDTDLVIKISEYIPFTPSDYDLSEFTNESADPFVRVSEVPPAETTASIQAKRPLKTVNSQSLEGSGNVEIASVSSTQSGIVNNNSLQELGGVDKLINGIRIGRGNNNADGNTAIGFETLLLNSTGQSNTAIGDSSLRANTTGNSNVGVGNKALFLNTIGLNNMAVGDSALRSNTIGNRNSAIGDSSLRANTTGNSNVGVGNNSLLINTTGSNNVAIGQGAGQNITTGSNNTYIGQGTSLGNTSNTIVLASGTNNRLIIDENGQIQIIQTPATGTTADAILVRNADGSVRQIPTSAVGGATNLSYTPSPTNGIVVSDTGTDATIPLADATNAGLLSPSEKLAIGSMNKTLYLNSDVPLDDTAVLQPVFGLQEFDFLANSVYEFEGQILLNDETNLSSSDLSFGMLGDTSEIENIAYIAISNLEPNDTGGVLTKIFYRTSFSAQIVQFFGTSQSIYAIKIKGTFKTINSGAIQPAIIGNAFTTDLFGVKGTYIKFNKLNI